VPTQQVEAVVEQTAESLATVPLLDLAFERQGIEAPVTRGLHAVLEGRVSAEDWLESVRNSGGGKARHAA
jgi:glycerol-3-phosphate dehydrogenase